MIHSLKPKRQTLLIFFNSYKSISTNIIFNLVSMTKSTDFTYGLEPVYFRWNFKPWYEYN